MRLQSVSCNNCGAPLEVPPSARYASCAHCGSRLEVKRTGSASYTEVLERLDERTEQMAESLETIRLQGELERLDREWHAARDRFVVHDRHGRASEPSYMGAVMSGVAVLFGLFWMGIAGRIAGPGFSAFGLLFIVMAILVGIRSVTATQDLARAREEYERQRTEILAELRGERGALGGR